MLFALIPLLLASPQDYDGDGYADLAIGISYEDGPSGSEDAGAVCVLYGSAVGLKAARNQLWSQNSPGIGGQVEADDHFGRVMAWGDYDADGYDDLAIGVAYEDIGSLLGVGFVHVLYGSPLGLSAARSQLWAQEDLGLGQVSDEHDNFGYDLARGDFDGDGYDDLAISAPKKAVSGMAQAGAAYVLYGGPAGVDIARAQLWHQDQPGLEDQAEYNEQFATSLSSGDFNADGLSDLAVGILNEESAAGGVQLLYGTPNGLSAQRSQLWTQDRSRVPANSEPGDEWGRALAAGDFDGDGASDLAIGARQEERLPLQDCGAVTVLYGSLSGLQTHQAQLWSQNSPGMRGVAESFDWFGAVLLAGDWDMDGTDDLFVTALRESYGGLTDAGAVQVILGGPAGLTAANNFILSQGSHGLGDAPDSGDYFGHGLGSGDFDGNGFADFAIGAPREDLGNHVNAGIVHVLYSRPVRRVEEWTQDTPGVLGQVEGNDYFGRAFAR